MSIFIYDTERSIRFCLSVVGSRFALIRYTVYDVMSLGTVLTSKLRQLVVEIKQKTRKTLTKGI